MSASPVVIRARNVLAQIVRIREALEDGDTEFAYAIATQAEYDLVGAIELLEAAPDDQAQRTRLLAELEAELDRLRALNADLADFLALPRRDRPQGGSR